MPTFSFTLNSGLPAGPSNSSDPALSPDDGQTSACIPRFRTEQEFLDVVDRLVPFEYIEPLKNPGPGYEIIQMMASVMERVSVAIGKNECGGYISYATGGFKAKGEVEFFRPSTSTGAFTIKRGTVVRASKTGRKFSLLADIEFATDDQILIGEVEAFQADAAFNLPGPYTTLGGELLPGEIDEIVLPLLDPPFAERELQCRQATATEGGQCASLDEKGADRSIARETGESDDVYRGRISQFPDTISPDALRRQLDSIFLPLGLTYTLFETWENAYQSCWNAPAGEITNNIYGNYNPNLFVWNDPRTNPPFRNRWMGGCHHIGGIVVVVPDLDSVSERGFVMDDTATDSDDLAGARGARAFSAYDIPSVPLDETVTKAAAFDAGDEDKKAFYLRIADVLQKIKGGGTFAAIELEGQ